MEEKSESQKESDFCCNYCGKTYKQEVAFLKHRCEKRDRMIDRDQHHVKMAFTAFNRFYELNYRSQKPKTFSHFVESKFYKSFIAFGKYLSEIKAVRPIDFIDFVLKSGQPIQKWTSPVIYQTYLRELVKKESYDVALDRSFETMREWAEKRGLNWKEFFSKVETPYAVLMVQSGQLSPWVVYLASTSSRMFDRLSDEQLQLVNQNIDVKFWEQNFKRHQDEVSVIQEILEQEGI